LFIRVFHPHSSDPSGARRLQPTIRFQRFLKERKNAKTHFAQRLIDLRSIDPKYVTDFFHHPLRRGTTPRRWTENTIRFLNSLESLE
jgi:hypothetical protein